MPIAVEYSDYAHTLIVKISGIFSYELFQEFKQACDQENPGKKILIDLREFDYIDSSFMGMLVQLRQDPTKEDYEISISNCTKHVKDALLMAQFDTLFSIS